MIKLEEEKKYAVGYLKNLSIGREELDEICRILSHYGDLIFISKNYQFESLDEIREFFGPDINSLSIINENLTDDSVKKETVGLKVDLCLETKVRYLNESQADALLSLNLYQHKSAIVKILNNNQSVFREFLSSYIGMVLFFIVYVFGIYILLPETYIFWIFLVLNSLLMGLSGSSEAATISLRYKHDTFLFRNREKMLSSSVPPILGAIAGAVITYIIMKFF